MLINVFIYIIELIIIKSITFSALLYSIEWNINFFLTFLVYGFVIAFPCFQYVFLSIYTNKRLTLIEYENYYIIYIIITF